MEKAHLYEALYLVNHGIDEAVRGVQRLKKSPKLFMETYHKSMAGLERRRSIINLQFMLEMRKLEENDESYFEEEFNVWLSDEPLTNDEICRLMRDVERERKLEGKPPLVKFLPQSKRPKRAHQKAERVHSGRKVMKPKEARHDADVYRLYQKVAREIECSGGKVRRVVLDFELKKDLYQALSRMRPDKDPRYERIFIANQFDLKVVDGKIPIPDLRIEYEDDCRDVRRLDLEIATRDYRPQGLGEKAEAGFHMFARQQDHAKLRRVLDTQEISARIFSL
jgi:hypothetical protein